MVRSWPVIVVGLMVVGLVVGDWKIVTAAAMGVVALWIGGSFFVEWSDDV